MSSLFSETSSQRFRRESREMWEQMVVEEGLSLTRIPGGHITK